jgi:hypothetical protein
MAKAGGIVSTGGAPCPPRRELSVKPRRFPDRGGDHAARPVPGGGCASGGDEHDAVEDLLAPVQAHAEEGDAGEAGAARPAQRTCPKRLLTEARWGSKRWHSPVNCNHGDSSSSRFRRTGEGHRPEEQPRRLGRDSAPRDLLWGRRAGAAATPRSG